MTAKTWAIAAAALIAGGIFANYGQADSPPAGRYQITGDNIRVWRLDTITGEITTCTTIKRNTKREFRCQNLP